MPGPARVPLILPKGKPPANGAAKTAKFQLVDIEEFQCPHSITVRKARARLTTAEKDSICCWRCTKSAFFTVVGISTFVCIFLSCQAMRRRNEISSNANIRDTIETVQKNLEKVQNVLSDIHSDIDESLILNKIFPHSMSLDDVIISKLKMKTKMIGEKDKESPFQNSFNPSALDFLDSNVPVQAGQDQYYNVQDGKNSKSNKNSFFESLLLLKLFDFSNTLRMDTPNEESENKKTCSCDPKDVCPHGIFIDDIAEADDANKSDSGSNNKTDKLMTNVLVNLVQDNKFRIRQKRKVADLFGRGGHSMNINDPDAFKPNPFSNLKLNEDSRAKFNAGGGLASGDNALKLNFAGKGEFLPQHKMIDNVGIGSKSDLSLPSQNNYGKYGENVDVSTQVGNMKAGGLYSKKLEVMDKKIAGDVVAHAHLSSQDAPLVANAKEIGDESDSKNIAAFKESLNIDFAMKNDKKIALTPLDKKIAVDIVAEKNLKGVVTSPDASRDAIAEEVGDGNDNKNIVEFRESLNFDGGMKNDKKVALSPHNLPAPILEPNNNQFSVEKSLEIEKGDKNNLDISKNGKSSFDIDFSSKLKMSENDAALQNSSQALESNDVANISVSDVKEIGSHIDEVKLDDTKHLTKVDFSDGKNNSGSDFNPSLKAEHNIRIEEALAHFDHTPVIEVSDLLNETVQTAERDTPFNNSSDASLMSTTTIPDKHENVKEPKTITEITTGKETSSETPTTVKGFTSSTVGKEATAEKIMKSSTVGKETTEVPTTLKEVTATTADQKTTKNKILSTAKQQTTKTTTPATTTTETVATKESVAPNESNTKGGKDNKEHPHTVEAETSPPAIERLKTSATTETTLVTSTPTQPKPSLEDLLQAGLKPKNNLNMDSVTFVKGPGLNFGKGIGASFGKNGKLVEIKDAVVIENKFIDLKGAKENSLKESHPGTRKESGSSKISEDTKQGKESKTKLNDSLTLSHDKNAKPLKSNITEVLEKTKRLGDELFGDIILDKVGNLLIGDNKTSSVHLNNETIIGPENTPKSIIGPENTSKATDSNSTDKSADMQAEDKRPAANPESDIKTKNESMRKHVKDIIEYFVHDLQLHVQRKEDELGIDHLDADGDSPATIDVIRIADIDAVKDIVNKKAGDNASKDDSIHPSFNNDNSTARQNISAHFDNRNNNNEGINKDLPSIGLGLSYNLALDVSVSDNSSDSDDVDGKNQEPVSKQQYGIDMNESHSKDVGKSGNIFVSSDSVHEIGTNSNDTVKVSSNISLSSNSKDVKLGVDNLSVTLKDIGNKESKSQTDLNDRFHGNSNGTNRLNVVAATNLEKSDAKAARDPLGKLETKVIRKRSPIDPETLEPIGNETIQEAVGRIASHYNRDKGTLLPGLSGQTSD